MKLDRHRAYAKLQLAKLRERHPWLQPDTDDVIDLYEASGPCVDPPGASVSECLDMPVHCGNVTLYRLTPGAIMWIEDCGIPWFRTDRRVSEFVIAFALAHAHEPEVFQRLTDRDTARKEIIRWARGLRCSHARLCDAVESLLPRSDGESEQPDNPSNWNLFLAAVCSEFGGTPDSWLWKVPMTVAVDMLRNRADKKRSTFTLDDPIVCATMRLQTVIRGIVKKHEEKRQNEIDSSRDAGPDVACEHRDS